jgi:hypothetical protein
MEALIEFVTQNPLYGLGIAAGVLLLLVALVKKMTKFAIIVVILIAGYGYYLQDMAQDAYSKTEAKVDVAKDKAEDLIDEAGALLKQ